MTNKTRGFASMPENKQKMIASMGGQAAHRSGNAHEFTSEEARAAGLKSHANRRAKAEKKLADQRALAQNNGVMIQDY